MERQIKLVIVGRGGIGKRSMLYTFFNNKFPEEKFGHAFAFQDLYDARVKIEINDKIYQLTAWDCGSGGEEYGRLRPFKYIGADVFIVGFSTVQPDTFTNGHWPVKQWVREVRGCDDPQNCAKNIHPSNRTSQQNTSQRCPNPDLDNTCVYLYHISKNYNVPILLVGMQTDLRADRFVVEQLASKGEKPVTKEMGEQLAREVGAVGYMECSALTGEGLKEVFDEVIKVAVNPVTKDTKKCVLL